MIVVITEPLRDCGLAGGSTRGFPVGGFSGLSMNLVTQEVEGLELLSCPEITRSATPKTFGPTTF